MSSEMHLQAGADIPERLHTASRAIAAALTNSSQLQQQIRVQALTQPSKSSQTVHQPVGDEPMHEQMQSLLDTLLQGTYTALRQEFQNNTLYKVFQMLDSKHWFQANRPYGTSAHMAPLLRCVLQD